jgi:hypothetical protein
MDVIYQRLEHRRLQLAQEAPGSPFLKRILDVMHKADNLARSVSRA